MNRKEELRGFSPAIADMLERDGVLDDLLSGGGLVFDNPPAPPTPQPEPFRPPAPDWAAEERERQAREREVKERELAGVIEAELARLTDDHEPPDPLPNRRGWKRAGSRA